MVNDEFGKVGAGLLESAVRFARVSLERRLIKSVRTHPMTRMIICCSQYEL